MKHHVCAWYVRTFVYVHVCTDIAQYIKWLPSVGNLPGYRLRHDDDNKESRLNTGDGNRCLVVAYRGCLRD